MRSFVPDVHVERRVVRAPEPVGRFTAGSLDFAWGLGLSGRAGGRIRIGEPSDRSVRFSGDLGPLQFFRGAASLLPRGTVSRAGFNTALPSTHGPPAQPNLVLDLIGRNSQSA